MRISLKEVGLFAEAWICLAIARLMLVFMPFKRIVPFLKRKKANRRADHVRLGMIQLAIARACVRSPWRTKCFEQALAAKMMLNRRGIESTVSFGLRKASAGDAIEAHAWLQSGDFVVTGWQQVNTYDVIAVF